MHGGIVATILEGGRVAARGDDRHGRGIARGRLTSGEAHLRDGSSPRDALSVRHQLAAESGAVMGRVDRDALDVDMIQVLQENDYTDHPPVNVEYFDVPRRDRGGVVGEHRSRRLRHPVQVPPIRRCHQCVDGRHVGRCRDANWAAVTRPHPSASSLRSACGGCHRAFRPKIATSRVTGSAHGETSARGPKRNPRGT